MGASRTDGGFLVRELQPLSLHLQDHWVLFCVGDAMWIAVIASLYTYPTSSFSLKH